MEIYENTRNVSSKDEFIEFLNLLKRNLEEKPEEWENNDLMSFLEALLGYSADSIHEAPSWRLFSELLLAARVYE
ncbi:hypothetical protein HP439_09380 [Sphingobacterium shayense]|uniref:DUF7660 family protein n=1 Tax=Sphingobacterium shayense TaxID=626343 RepID=UPI0015578E05|nr:hypothetical protein [Sphingobacterium shayense]NQD70927.1 hypothetical protein [Sphingobacterium shayense]